MFSLALNIGIAQATAPAPMLALAACQIATWEAAHDCPWQRLARALSAATAVQPADSCRLKLLSPMLVVT